MKGKNTMWLPFRRKKSLDERLLQIKESTTEEQALLNAIHHVLGIKHKEALLGPHVLFLNSAQYHRYVAKINEYYFALAGDNPIASDVMWYLGKRPDDNFNILGRFASIKQLAEMVNKIGPS